MDNKVKTYEELASTCELCDYCRLNDTPRSQGLCKESICEDAYENYLKTV